MNDEDDKIRRLKEAFATLQRGYEVERCPTVTVRRDRLYRLAAMLNKYETRLIEAMSDDFGHRSHHESAMFDIVLSLSEIGDCRRHVRKWMRPRRVPTRFHLRPAKSRIIPQPLGVVGVMTPWNFPVYLGIGGVADAIAAGNRVLLKPSELTPATSEVQAEAIAEFFAPDEFNVAIGGVEVAQAFSDLPFDHILFTGSTAVGRKVAEAAGRNLTPVTLELGGKSPALVTPSARLGKAARSIAHAKLANAGQICIAADYVLVPEAMRKDFVHELGACMTKLYPTYSDNPDYTAIVSDTHFERLGQLVDDAVAGGANVIRPHHDGPATTRKFPPTILTDLPENCRVMQEEIFGPVLPVIGYDGLDDAIARINGRDRPLALYVFSESSSDRDRVLAETVSGGVVINDCLWHVPNDSLPFGGVGASGMGAYHGRAGFDAMSKLKPVMYQSRLSATSLLYPPFRAPDREVRAFAAPDHLIEKAMLHCSNLLLHCSIAFAIVLLASGKPVEKEPDMTKHTSKTCSTSLTTLEESVGRDAAQDSVSRTLGAVTATGRALFDGVIAFDRALLGSTKVAFTDTMNHGRESLRAKNVHCLLELQAQFVKHRYETVNLQATELSELTRTQLATAWEQLRDIGGTKNKPA
ncbi:aldehyde dehydrogenase family protein [Leisingera sp. NJS204]|uniref:aldehyde dehydrogenase family protein n=1 Tax=Leisingera sp. NJS204 TaxID=2508307 RepID=UPI0010115692|nr:aldehyde dehydrogenase family protein [Leisingera sp. NJS204]QAX30755.1 aldehyde dehydrogenase family protein [Leisingera sp. NJS204]